MELATKYAELCQQNGFHNSTAQIEVITILESFGNLLLNAPKRHIKHNFFAYCINFFMKPSDIHISPLGVYIYGDVGRGKSMLMDLFYKNIPLKNKKRIHFHHFMHDTHIMLKKARNDNTPDALLNVADMIAAECRLLCFDEFQVLDITDAMLLGRLFNALIQRDVKFVMTSNRPPDDLYLNGLNRQLFLPFIELLKTQFQIVNLNHGTDFRLEKIKHHNHYLYPLNSQTHASFEKIWSILTDYQSGDVCSLDNAGRKINFSKTHKHILYTDFHQLCDTALGASDYMVITDRFSVLLLDNIPQLTSDMRNQATRFRTLIDIFYEKRNKIYFRCAVPLENLYAKGDYTFEFERTLSRIAEMQAKDYGNA
jgi:cell division protein ZapE